MGWQWHQLDHMQIICTSLQTDNHASTSSLNFYGLDALPTAQPTVSKHWKHSSIIIHYRSDAILSLLRHQKIKKFLAKCTQRHVKMITCWMHSALRLRQEPTEPLSLISDCRISYSRCRQSSLDHPGTAWNVSTQSTYNTAHKLPHLFTLFAYTG